MLLVISMVTYIDRVTVSIAGKYIRDLYGLSPVEMGQIFSAFVVRLHLRAVKYLHPRPLGYEPDPW